LIHEQDLYPRHQETSQLPRETDCPQETYCNCDAVVDRALPRSLRIAGDLEAENEARERDKALKEKEQAEAAKPDAERKVR
jgi:hypothetical protein